MNFLWEFGYVIRYVRCIAEMIYPVLTNRSDSLNFDIMNVEVIFLHLGIEHIGENDHLIEGLKYLNRELP